jgi:hypothetical protein
MNTTHVLYMPIPMQLVGKGFVPPGYGSRDFKDEINPGINLRQTNPLGWQEINKDNIGAAFQGLLNTVTANPAQYTPGYDPMSGQGGHHPGAKQLIDAFTGQGINLRDDTGSVQLTPGGLNIQSNKGWSAGFNPTGGNINVGPVGIQGTWAGDKSIQATFSLGTPKEQRMGNTMMNMMKPVDIHGPGGNVTYEVQSPLNEAQKLRDQMLYEYEQKNPYYYRP